MGLSGGVDLGALHNDGTRQGVVLAAVIEVKMAVDDALDLAFIDAVEVELVEQSLGGMR